MEDIIYTVLHSKYQQVTSSKEALLATYHKTIAEASKDKRWGCGLLLDDEHVLDQSKWTGSNIFGKLLGLIRDGLMGSLDEYNDA